MNPLSINLPFSPGDTVYYVFIDEADQPNYMQLIISHIQIMRNDGISIAVCFVNHPFIWYKEGDNYFFSTRDEAEKRCAELLS